MDVAVAGARVVVVAIDVAMVCLATRIALHRGGAVAAVATGSVLAVHPAFAVMGAQPLIDVPAAAALVWACERGLGADRIGRRRAAGLAVALVLTLALRIQLAPAVVVLVAIVVVAHRRGVAPWDRGAGVSAALAGLAAFATVALLDALTWGAPFSSTVDYLRYNLGAGRTAFGTMPADRYVRDAGAALGLLAVVLPLLGVAAGRRGLAIALVMVAVVLPHQLVAYRVWRFVHPALPLLVLWGAVGVDRLASRVSEATRRRGLALAAIALLIEVGWATARQAPWTTTWLYDRGGIEAIERSRGLNRAYLALSGRPAPHAIDQAVLPASASPGYALLGHDVVVFTSRDARPTPTEAAGVDVIIAPGDAFAGRSPPPGFAVIWRDDVAGIVIESRPRPS
jgi:hypothetical protein